MVGRSWVLWLAFAGCTNTKTATTTEAPLIDGPVGLLIILDNSASMVAFSETLVNELEDGLAVLADLDVRIGVTTPDVEGLAGELLGGGTFESDEISRVANTIRNHAICDSGLNCGSGEAEPLEAAFLAACRAAEAPAASCTSDVQVDGTVFASPLAERDLGSSSELLAGGRTLVTIVLSDEGDSSRRMAQGDFDPQVYVDAVKANGHGWISLVIGPPVDDQSEPVCPSPAPDWSAMRLVLSADQTGGTALPILDKDCEPLGAGDQVADALAHLF